MPRTDRRTGTLAILLALALVVSACTSGGDDSGAPTTTIASSGGPGTTDDSGSTVDPVEDVVRIEVLSSQPDRVTGDDARIRVTPSSGVDAGSLRVDVDGTDVTAKLDVVEGALEGVIDGLVEGTNSLTVTGDEDPATLRLRAWSRSGPMISGPQLPLLVCSTVAHGLGASTGPTCDAPTKVTFRYVTVDGDLEDLADPAEVPEDAATVTDGAGEEHPAIIRVERGVLNRFVYEWSVAVQDPDSNPEAPVSPVWTDRLLHRFHDGCGATHGQGTLATDPLDADLLVDGWAVATSTGNIGAVRCNDVVSAETTMMIQERIIEVLGRPERTIGEGTGSGGAQVRLIAQNYPDLLDGGVTIASHPDDVTLANELADCILFDRYLDGPGADLDAAQVRAIAGHDATATCEALSVRYGNPFDPARGCDPELPTDRIASEANPTGVRCSIESINEVTWGITEESATGSGDRVVTRPLDNEGVQYGLDALNEGVIDLEEFLDLNRSIGGLDADGSPTTERMAQAPIDVARFYETGRVSAGTGDQAEIPFIDIVAAEGLGGDSSSVVLRALAQRERLLRTAGHADGQQIWEVGDPSTRRLDAIAAVDAWLVAMDGAGSGSLAESRPDAATARCARPGEEAITDAAAFDADGRGCLTEDPDGTLRTAAGAHRSLDAIRCQLKPVDPFDYDVPISADDLDLMWEVFPTGVCDWAYLGAGQTVPTMPDRTFADEDTPASRA